MASIAIGRGAMGCEAIGAGVVIDARRLERDQTFSTTGSTCRPA
jgi:hypothetical protein